MVYTLTIFGVAEYEFVRVICENCGALFIEVNCSNDLLVTFKNLWMMNECTNQLIVAFEDLFTEVLYFEISSSPT